MKKQTSNSFISIVIPVLNEEENVPLLAKEIESVMAPAPWNWECLWIDDFSTDGTVEELRKICTSNSRHRLVLHRKNYGQSAALATGFRHAKGNIIVTLDGDGQNDPRDIPKLITTLLQHDADMVNGLREKRRDSLIRRLSSKIANLYRNALTGENVRDVGCSIRAFKKECVKDLPVFKGMHRFFPTLVKLSGDKKILEIPVNHRPRLRGKAKYGINNRLWVGIVDTFAVCWMKKRMVYPEAEEMNFTKNM